MLQLPSDVMIEMLGFLPISVVVYALRNVCIKLRALCDDFDVVFVVPSSGFILDASFAGGVSVKRSVLELVRFCKLSDTQMSCQRLDLRPRGDLRKNILDFGSLLVGGRLISPYSFEKCPRAMGRICAPYYTDTSKLIAPRRYEKFDITKLDQWVLFRPRNKVIFDQKKVYWMPRFSSNLCVLGPFGRLTSYGKLFGVTLVVTFTGWLPGDYHSIAMSNDVTTDGEEVDYNLYFDMGTRLYIEGVERVSGSECEGSIQSEEMNPADLLVGWSDSSFSVLYPPLFRRDLDNFSALRVEDWVQSKDSQCDSVSWPFDMLNEIEDFNFLEFKNKFNVSGEPTFHVVRFE
jgi:hypothetical protein